MLRFNLERLENILGKGESASYQSFLLFLQCFSNPAFLGSLKTQESVVKG